MTQQSIEDAMFFVRLRRHAKWMFVFLAVIFAGGFVIFGVGANNAGTGIGDVLAGGGGSGGAASVSDARERVEENPKDADARRELATALATDGQNGEAIEALTAYVGLRPTDQAALRELAGLYLTEGNVRQQEAQNAQTRAAYLTAGSITEPLKLGDGGVTLGENPITTAVTTEANEAINAALGKAQEAYTAAVTTYEKLVRVVPNDPNVQLELAQTAEQARDYPKAIAAYQQFLKLAPDDPSAAIVKTQIKQLQAALRPAASG
ncbi:MAG: tetratricopeptide repeat protein [Gaiellaceae bacterium MAG52_C11]|nr:tetratricopeptide repeat protein [Candidatus Gaiellasilicea maunaloa]